MSADKYPCIFSRQMETIVYIYTIFFNTFGHLLIKMCSYYLQVGIDGFRRHAIKNYIENHSVDEAKKLRYYRR